MNLRILLLYCVVFLSSFHIKLSANVLDDDDLSSKVKPKIDKSSIAENNTGWTTMAEGTSRSGFRFDEHTCRDINSCENPNKRCVCDELCPYLGDCCWNALRSTRALPEAMSEALPTLTCTQLQEEGYFWVVSDCPSGYRDSEIKTKCNKKSQTNIHDPEIAVPVFDASTNLTFQNRFCAMCHGARDVVTYKMSVGGFENGCKLSNASLQSDVLKHYLSENSSCIVEFRTDSHYQRPCFANLVSKCPGETWSSTCYGEPINPIYVHTVNGHEIFRNYICYECSTLYPSENLSCTKEALHEDFPMTVLLDTTGLLTRRWTMDSSGCKEGHIYDHIYVRYLLFLISFGRLN